MVAYVPSTKSASRTITVDMAQLSSPANARWYNPTNGAFTAIEGSPLVNSGLRKFATPGDSGTGTNDWVLVVESVTSQPRHADSEGSPAGKLIPDAGRGDTRQPAENAETGGSAVAVPGTAAEEPAARLAAYRAELDAFRKEYGGTRDLPDVRFFLFGMGQRAKFIYRDGRLRDARSGKVVREWKLKSDVIVPPDYLVALETADGAEVTIVEDEQAVWIEVGGQRIAMEGTQSAVRLPTVRWTSLRAGSARAASGIAR